jgi:pilus assembly protein FimV
MIQPPQRTVLRTAVLLSLAFYGSQSSALGLGPLRLQSALGQRLNATVQVLGPEAKSLTDNCIRTRLASPDGSDILNVETEIRRLKGGRIDIALTSRQVIEEPAITLVIEVICAPELHRDYQLLLDLKDGLPHVLQQVDTDPARPAIAPASTRRTASASDSSGSHGGKRRSSVRTLPVAAGLDLEETNTDAPTGSVPKRVAKTGIPRNVLKLSQPDESFIRKAGLRMSESLSVPEAPFTPDDRESISAAKTRFLAMMRDEDPVLVGLRQIQALQSQLDARPPAVAAGPAPNASTTVSTTPAITPSITSATLASTTATAGTTPAAIPPQQPVVPPAGTTAGESKPAVPSAGEDAPPQLQKSAMPRMPAFNKWLIGLALLLLASVAVLPVLLKIARRGGEGGRPSRRRSATDASSREASLLQSARLAATGKKKKTILPESALIDPVHEEDLALLRYVEQYADKTFPERIKSASDDVASAEPANPVKATVAAEPVLAAAKQPAPSRAVPATREGATVELISDVMQEAEFWKMLNETQRAIDILENYCTSDAAISNSPVPWLYLAELYIASGDFDRHEQLGHRFRLRFNGQITALPATGEMSLRTLEDYPHLIHQISELWGKRTVVPFLQDLLVNKRDDPRQGFELPVYREILLLIDVAREREKSAA